MNIKAAAVKINDNTVWHAGNSNFVQTINSIYNIQLTSTSATNVITYTPSAAGNFVVWVYYRIATAATVLGITCTYTDAGGSQTKTILSSASQAVGSYTCTPLFISSTASAITVTATAGTANNAYISAAISMM